MSTLLGLTMTGSNWELGNFLNGALENASAWGQIIVMIIGVVMVVAAVYQIAKGLISHGKGGQTNWVMTFLLLVLGGILMISGGWQFLQDISAGTKETLEGMGAAICLFL